MVFLTNALSKTGDADCQLVKKMEATLYKEDRNRAVPRNPTEAAIACQPYTSSANIRASEGVMRNFSTEGSYIETSQKFKSGTILIVRVLRYPLLSLFVADEEQPKSICLAEVKWLQELAEENPICFGLGLKYLN
jgi:hypothetical protein